MSDQIKPKKIIINVDDFGMSHAVNLGVFECCKAGTISSTTMLVNRPSSAEAADFAKECPELGVGLHFNLTLGRPISDRSKVPRLVNADGDFFGSRSLKKRWLCGKVDSYEVSLELQAQFEKLISFGMSPSHIDSHDHIHVVPLVFDALAAFCERMNLPMRIPWVNVAVGRLTFKKQISRFIMKLMLYRNLKKCHTRLRSNHAFVGILNLGKAPEEIGMHDYFHLLQTTQNNPIELMVHLADIDEKDNKLGFLKRLNRAEMDIISQRAFREKLQSGGFELVTYTAV